MELSWSLSNGSRLTAFGTSERHAVKSHFPLGVHSASGVTPRLRGAWSKGDFAAALGVVRASFASQRGGFSADMAGLLDKVCFFVCPPKTSPLFPSSA